MDNGTSRRGRYPRKGISSLASDDFSVIAAIGGIRGMVESVLPGLVFLALFVTTHSLLWTVLVSVAIAVAELAARLLQRQPITGALSGIGAVAICLVWAWLSRDARNYYLPGFIVNAVLIVLLVVSLAARIPGIGCVVEFARDASVDRPSQWLHRWNDDPGLHRAYTYITWIWVAVLISRLAVQVPLYYTNQIGLLGTARLLMGLPLYALVIWVSWLIAADHIHRNKLARQQEASDRQEDPSDLSPEMPAEK
mgnify:FL=1